MTRLPTDDDAVASGDGWDDDGFGSLQPIWNSQTNNTRRRGSQYYHPVQGACGKTRHAAHRPQGRSGFIFGSRRSKMFGMTGTLGGRIRQRVFLLGVNASNTDTAAPIPMLSRSGTAGGHNQSSTPF